MRRARFWLAWSLRDLRRRWLVVGATGLLIALGTGLYTGLGGLERWRVRSNDASFALLAMHDLRVTLSEGSFAPAGTLAAATAGVDGVAAVEERLVVPTQVDASAAGRTVLVPGKVVGLAGARIDRVHVVDGRGLSAQDAGEAHVVVEASFAERNGIAPGARIGVAGTPVEVVGTGRSPNEFLVLVPGGWGGEAAFAVIYAPLASVQAQAARGAVVNELVVRYAAGADPSATRAAVARAIGAALPDVGSTSIAQEEEQVWTLLYRDARNDQRMFTVFAWLILAGATFAAFNLVGRIVESERREIGIGMALGVEPWRLALRPLLMAAEIALAGAGLGVAIGLGVGELLGGVVRDQLPLPVTVTPFDVRVFLVGAGLGFLVPFVAAAFPVWRGVRVAPIEAIRVGFRAARGIGLATALRRVPLPGASLAQLPLRNLLRAPRRALATVLGLAAVIATVVALTGMLDSLRATVDAARVEVLAGAPDRLAIELDGARPASSDEVGAVLDSPALRDAEPGLRLAGSASTPAGTIDLAVTLVDPGSPLWVPQVARGQLPAGPGEVALAAKALDDLGLSLGDVVTLRLPRRTGVDSFAFADVAATVVGQHASPIRTIAYLHRAAADDLALTGVANRVSARPAAGTSVADAQRALFGLAGVASVQPVSAQTDAVREAIDTFLEVVRIAGLAALALALLMAFNAVSIALDERTREHATMLAFGLPVRSLLRVNVVEGAVVGVLGTGLGIALGYGIVGWIARSLVAETLPELGMAVSLSAGSILVAGAVGVLAPALAPLLTARRLTRLELPGALRVVE